MVRTGAAILSLVALSDRRQAELALFCQNEAPSARADIIPANMLILLRSRNIQQRQRPHPDFEGGCTRPAPRTISQRRLRWPRPFRRVELSDLELAPRKSASLIAIEALELTGEIFEDRRQLFRSLQLLALDVESQEWRNTIKHSRLWECGRCTFPVVKRLTRLIRRISVGTRDQPEPKSSHAPQINLRLGDP